MTATTTFVDVEGAYRDWLRAQPEMVTLVGQRVFLGLPERAMGNEASFPCVTVFKISSVSQSSGEVILDSARLQFDCWGPLKKRSAATAVMLAVKNLLNSVTRGTVLRSGIRAAETYGITDLWFPDPRTDRPRYIVDAVCMASIT